MIGFNYLTPEDIDETPELGPLTLLETAIDVTRCFLLSLYRELAHPDEEDRNPDLDYITLIVKTVLILGDALGDQIRVYRWALERRQQDKLRRTAEVDF